MVGVCDSSPDMTRGLGFNGVTAYHCAMCVIDCIAWLGDASSSDLGG